MSCGFACCSRLVTEGEGRQKGTLVKCQHSSLKVKCVTGHQPGPKGRSNLKMRILKQKKEYFSTS